MLLAIVVSITVYLFDRRLIPALVSFAMIWLGGFILITIAYERFIDRNIKLMYKLIYQTKATKREEFYFKHILPKKTIDQVRVDVEAWAMENKKELELLRSNEQFRKEFLQNLSHEFKTPVFAIQGYVDTLLNGAIENPEVNVKFLEKAATNVERLTNLLNDLDEISKLERGELHLQKENFVIQDLVKETFESISIIAMQKNIRTQIKKGCESPLTVFADKFKIKQVLLNLVENSIKYGKHNGSINASMYNTDGKHILIEISDDGIGIPERHLPRIFERFYRTEEGRSIDITGSGLGLAICKHIIEAHGQPIHVRSREDVGTSIGFLLEGGKSNNSQRL